MPTKKLDGQYYDSLLDEYNDFLTNGGSVGEFASLQGLKESQLRGRLMIARELRAASQPDDNPLAINFDLGQVWELEGNWAIIGDIHAPFAHLPTLKRMVAIARRYMSRPRKLIIAGDLFNQDTFSRYPAVVGTPSWGLERNFVRALMSEWLEEFQEIRMIMGNHDRRLQKFTAGAFETTDILALVVSNPERVRISNYGYCLVNSGEVQWRITHPANYSRQPLNVAGRLADLKGTNVISFHEHHLGKSHSAGGHIVLNGGCAVDPAKLAYVTLDDGLSPKMQNGFVTLIDGFAQEWGDENYTDWSKWI